MLLMLGSIGTLLQFIPHGMPVTIPDGFLTGETYVRTFSEAQREAYTMGFVNGLLVSPFLATAAETPVSQLNACLKGRTATQLAEIVRRYINDRPERWNEILSVLGWLAIRDSCRP